MNQKKIERFQKLKEAVDKKKEDLVRAETLMDESETILRDKFGVETVDEANDLLEEMDKEIENMELKLDGYLDRWEKKFLNGFDDSID